MDPRVRALLEPKAYAKDVKKKKVTAKHEEPTIQATAPDRSKGKGQSKTPSTSISHRPIQTYDPKRLLDPRGARQTTKPEKSTSSVPNSDLSSSSHQVGMHFPQDRAVDTASPTNGYANGGSRSMIEDLYGVERRNERPVKRAKIDPDQEETKIKPRNSAHAHQSSGIIGQYLRPDADQPDQTTDHEKVVDLTQLDDEESSDDDVQIVQSRNVNEEEVCFGAIVAHVHAHATPKPRAAKSSIYGQNTHHPIVPCTTVRVRSKDTVIEVKDSHGYLFGRIEPTIATILTPFVDAMRGFRLQLYLHPRRKKPDEWPHQPCSENMVANINIYGLRADIARVGMILGQHNVWLRTPAMVEMGKPVENPHAKRIKDVALQNSGSSRGTIAESRTVEEATEAVTKLFDHYANTARPLEETEPASTITTILLPHQKQALTFMLQREAPRTYGSTENENSSLWRQKRKANGLIYYEETVTGIVLKEKPEEVYGGLLADVMGLGKTIEALALIAHTKEEAKDYGSQSLVRANASEGALLAQSKATLIVAPVSTVKNWEDQIREHIQPGTLTYYTYHGPNREKNPFKLAQYDVIISTYSTIAADLSSKGLGISPIKGIRWFRIILDEAHTIRESRANQSQAMYSLFAQRRWCLTGTPIQNRLDDLGSLTRFLRLYPYDTTMRFNQYVRSPAQSGDGNYLKSLRVFIDSFTLRRLKDRIDLPDREDLVVRLEFTNYERKLHDFFKDRAKVRLVGMAEEKKQHAVAQHHVLRAILTLRLICDHGKELLKKDDLEAFKSASKGTSKVEAIDVDAEDDSQPIKTTHREAYSTLALLAEADLDLCKQCDRRISGDSPRVEADNTDEVRGYMLHCYDLFCCDCFESQKAQIDAMRADESMRCGVCHSEVVGQYIAIPKTMAEPLDAAPEKIDPSAGADQEGAYTGPSTKVKALLEDLEGIRQESKQATEKGEPPIKSIVFSEFTSYLDLIEKGLNDHGFEGCYVRIDGTMSLNKRKAVLDSLNMNNSVTILLASIKAAGQGLNLTAASNAFIMEPMWNPAAEAQAVDRIHRIGQERKVTVRRYQISDSIEGNIIELQQKKQALAEVSMNKNHKMLSKKETREQQMKQILSLFK